MGPRPFGRGRATARSASILALALQWGRDLSVAEGILVYADRHDARSLQWGRDLSVAEGEIKSPPASEIVKLQWGRDLSVAEGGARKGRVAQLGRSFNGAATFRSRKAYSRPKCLVCSGRFNGAATFRSRKGSSARFQVRASTTLQWGRDLSVAEGGLAYAVVIAVPLASMGPRPFGRGRCHVYAA